MPAHDHRRNEGARTAVCGQSGGKCFNLALEPRLHALAAADVFERGQHLRRGQQETQQPSGSRHSGRASEVAREDVREAVDDEQSAEEIQPRANST